MTTSTDTSPIIVIDQTPDGWQFEPPRPYYAPPMHRALVTLPDTPPIDPQHEPRIIEINIPYEIDLYTHAIAVTDEGHRYALWRNQYVYRCVQRYWSERDPEHERMSVEAGLGQEVEYREWMYPLIDWLETYRLWGV